MRVFKQAVAQECKKQNPANIEVKSKETARKLGENLRNYQKKNKALEAYTQNVSGLLSSFFLPWTREYQLREETGKYLSKAESKFNKFTDLVYKSIKHRK